MMSKVRMETMNKTKKVLKTMKIMEKKMMIMEMKKTKKPMGLMEEITILILPVLGFQIQQRQMPTMASENFMVFLPYPN